jgi:hypothetical protein
LSTIRWTVNPERQGLVDIAVAAWALTLTGAERVEDDCEVDSLLEERASAGFTQITRNA